MPRDASIKRVLIIGSGPIVIGQACEFDYSGTQACRALREEGIGVVLLNSNPATIMTDPEVADRTYLEPITVETIDQILAIERERGTPVDSILPTLGGQTGLNCAMDAAKAGLLEKHKCRMIGANPEIIQRAEDRERFKWTVQSVGVDVPRSGTASTLDEAFKILERVELPAVIRPAYTLGGTGGGFARTREEFAEVVSDALHQSPISQTLIEEDLTGWKEFELEMMRDKRDNVVVVCSIENFDPMGVHTGDSITVAPALTLTDREYQRMRDAAIAIMRAVGVETGGSNIQFGVNPNDGRLVAIEMNPRVSRSSALASKATGFPIAKIATKLAIGYTLDEIRNDITRETPASFEPAIDYCVVKMPRFAFEKFPEADETLTTSMKSVGEAMAIGRTFKEAFQKCIRSMEIQRPGYGLHPRDQWLESLRQTPAAAPAATGAADGEVWFDAVDDQAYMAGTIGGSTLSEAPADIVEESASEWPIDEAKLIDKITTPCQGRIYYIRYALKLGWTVARIRELSGIDPWFLDQLEQLVAFEQRLQEAPIVDKGQVRLTPGLVATYREAKTLGYSDAQLRAIWQMSPDHYQTLKVQLDRPVYKLVDTCAAEFEAYTPYYYSTHERPMARVVHEPALVASLRASASEGRRVDLTSAARQLGVQGPFRYRLLDQERLLVQHHDDELKVGEKPKVVILGGGPNRIGQGIEFDYCCVHASMAARELDYETVMINSNPETVSTDYDISDKLFFEPLTHEDVFNICERMNGGPFRRTRLEYVIENDERLDRERDARLAACWQESEIGRGAVIDSYRRGYVVATTDRRCWALEIDGGGQCELYPLEIVPDERRAAAIDRAVAKLRMAPELLRGVIVQYGGQTPLNLAQGLADSGVPILGTSPEDIHLAEDRERFQQILNELGLRQPPNGIAFSRAEAAAVAENIGYPVLVRPSYVLGGRGMQVCNNASDLVRYIDGALMATDRDLNIDAQHPILIDKFLLDAVEVDVDAIADFGYPGRDAAEGRCDICGIMEHIEEAGIHSGDSSCVLPPYSLSPALVDEIKYQVKLMARRLRVCGLMNVQFAIQGRVVYVIEANPRASRTIPFVSKATGVPWAKLATHVMLGKSLDEAMADAGIRDVPTPRHMSVKTPVFPFRKLKTVDFVLGPEMRSTGEVMGIDERYPLAFAKALMEAGMKLPTRGNVLVSVNDPDKPRVVSIARDLHDMGFIIYSTPRTHATLAEAAIPSLIVSKQAGEAHSFLLDMIRGGKLDLLINTPIHTGSASDEGRWRVATIQRGIPLITTLAGARAAVGAIKALRGERQLSAKALQDYLARA